MSHNKTFADQRPKGEEMRLHRSSNSVVTLTVAVLAMAAGLLAGVLDIHSVSTPWETGFYVLVSATLAYMAPKLLWLGPLVLAFTLYAVHIWAIRHGYKPPYVEKNEHLALGCLLSVVPALLGGLVGGGLRLLRTWVATTW